MSETENKKETALLEKFRFFIGTLLIFCEMRGGDGRDPMDDFIRSFFNEEFFREPGGPRGGGFFFGPPKGFFEDPFFREGNNFFFFFPAVVFKTAASIR